MQDLNRMNYILITFELFQSILTYFEIDHDLELCVNVDSELSNQQANTISSLLNTVLVNLTLITK